MKYYYKRHPLARYTHDCEKCVFLGTYEDYDLYYCGPTPLRGSIIARYGSESHEYSSVPLPLLISNKGHWAEYSPEITKAYHLGLQRHLFTEE